MNRIPSGTYTLPRKYFEDYANRDPPTGTALSFTARTVTVRLTRDEYAELLGDARHYADPETGLTVEPGLRASAKRAVARLTDPDALHPA